MPRQETVPKYCCKTQCFFPHCDWNDKSLHNFQLLLYFAALFYGVLLYSNSFLDAFQTISNAGQLVSKGSNCGKLRERC